MMYQLPPVSELSNLPKDKLSDTFEHLFEPCAPLEQIILTYIFPQKYHTYTDFIELTRIELIKSLDTLPNETINTIISAHPRLGESTKSTHSTSEQKSLGEETEKLKQLNDLYERTFPGLRYIVFVNGRSREVIMEDMKRRIDIGDIEEEKRLAFNAMCDIALDRAKKLGGN